MNLDHLIRPHIKNLRPYSSARDEYSGKVGIFLDANENSFGSVCPEKYNRYPDPYQTELKLAVSALKKVTPEQIFIGNGSDEAIDLILRLFCRPGKDSIMVTPPTYGMYEVGAAIHEAKVISVPLTQKFELDIEKILQSAPPFCKIIFLCNPNNPTGNRFDPSAIHKILNTFQGIVVLDEAYIDFSDGSSYLEKLGLYKNLIVIQTFSKAWGMAGLRLGMAFADPKIIAYINKIKPPYNINEVSQKMAMVALANVEARDNMVDKILVEREKLRINLIACEQVLEVFPSDANFLLVKFKDSSGVFHSLIKKKIITRDRSRVIHCDQCLRITVGTPSENQALISEIRNYVPGNP